MIQGHDERHPVEMDDPEITSVLRDFRASANAWSEAAYQRPRTVPVTTSHIVWRRAVVWASGLVLAAGMATTGVYEHHHRQELARIRAQQEAERQRLLAAQRERETEELMAKIDRAISRQVPSAMDPLADLMDDATQ